MKLDINAVGNQNNSVSGQTTTTQKQNRELPQNDLTNTELQNKSSFISRKRNNSDVALESDLEAINHIADLCDMSQADLENINQGLKDEPINEEEISKKLQDIYSHTFDLYSFDKNEPFIKEEFKKLTSVSNLDDESIIATNKKNISVINSLEPLFNNIKNIMVKGIKNLPEDDINILLKELENNKLISIQNLENLGKHILQKNQIKLEETLIKVLDEVGKQPELNNIYKLKNDLKEAESKEFKEIESIIQNLSKKEPREELNELKKLKNNLKTNKVLNQLNNYIEDYSKSHLKNFSNGLNSKNINDFKVKVKELTKNSHWLATNRLIKSFYNSIDNLADVYSSGKIDKFPEALDKAIKEAKYFIDKSPNSTRVDWVKQIIPLLEVEKSKISQKVDLLKDLKSANALNINSLLQKGINNNTSLAGHIDSKKISNLFIAINELDKNTNKSSGLLSNSSDFVYKLGLIDKELTGNLLIESFKKKKIDYFTYYTLNINLRNDGNTKAIPRELESLKGNIKNDVRVLNSIMDKYFSQENSPEIDATFDTVKYLSSLDSKDLQKINSLGAKKPEELADLDNEVKKILGDKYEIFYNNKTELTKNGGLNALFLLESFILGSSLKNNFKEDNERLSVISKVSAHKNSKNIFNFQRTSITKQINYFSDNSFSQNINPFVDIAKQLTIQGNKNNKYIKPLHESLDSLKNSYSQNNPEEQILKIDNAITQCQTFLDNTSKSESKVWTKELKNILSKRLLVSKIENIKPDITSKDLNNLMRDAEDKFTIKDFDKDKLINVFNSIEQDNKSFKINKSTFSRYIVDLDKELIFKILGNEYNNNRISYNESMNIIDSVKDKLVSNEDTSISAATENLFSKYLNEDKFRQVEFLKNIKEICFLKVPDVDYMLNINQTINLLKSQDITNIINHRVQNEITSKDPKNILGKETYNEILDSTFGGKKVGKDVLEAIEKLINLRINTSDD